MGVFVCRLYTRCDRWGEHHRAPHTNTSSGRGAPVVPSRLQSGALCLAGITQCVSGFVCALQPCLMSAIAWRSLWGRELSCESPCFSSGERPSTHGHPVGCNLPQGITTIRHKTLPPVKRGKVIYYSLGHPSTHDHTTGCNLPQGMTTRQPLRHWQCL